MDTGHPQHHSRAVTASDVVAEARRLVGTLYRHQGRSEFGIDCIGVPIVIGQRLNLLPDSFLRANYGKLPKAELIEKTKDYCTRLDAIEPGALLLIRWPGEQNPGHAVIFTGETIVHAWDQHDRVVEHGYRGAWVKLTHSMWRLPGVIGG